MSTLDTYRKQAKRLVRWHHEANHSVAGRIRTLPRFAQLTDRQALDHPFTLAEAQEINAREAGHADWAALKAACEDAPSSPASRAPAPPSVSAAVPVLFVADVARSAAFYRDRLGFAVDFLHGSPPFYGSVPRDGATLHLKWVHAPVFGPGRIEAEGLIMAFLRVENVKALYAELVAGGVAIQQKLTKQAWGGSDFHVRDPDGNVIAFVG
jgi:catechol 2,3-dioxygenase-like lactoylglutathione lyase family enzyme